MKPSTQTIRPGTTKSTTLSGFLLSVQDGEKNPIRVRVFNQILSGKKIPVMQKIPVTYLTRSRAAPDAAKILNEKTMV